MTLRDGEDYIVLVYEGGELCVKQIKFANFNAKLEEMLNSTASQTENDTVRQTSREH